MATKLAAAFLVLLLSAPALWAVEPSERLTDPALEARARAVSEQLRCLVCRNETIDQSDAPLAHDLRVLLRRRIAAGDSDAQAMKFITDRYGDFVLLKSPVEPATYALWFGPAALLLLAAAGALAYLRQRNTAPPATPLTPAERRRVAEILRKG